MCLLALLLALMIANTCYTVEQIEGMMDAARAIPRPEEQECLGEAIALEAHWRRVRPIVGLSVNYRTIEQIDRLTLSMRATAADGDVGAFETDRLHLICILSDLRALMRCDVWEIL